MINTKSELNIYRIVRFALSILLVLFITMHGNNAYAAGGKLVLSEQFYRNNNQSKAVIQLEEGTTICLPAYVRYEKVSKDINISLDQVKGVKYSIKNKKIAKINSKGNLTAKSTGTTMITIKYAGKKLKVNLTVVQKQCSQEKVIKSINNAIKKFDKGISAKDSFTKANRIKKLKQLCKICELQKESMSENSDDMYIYDAGVYKGVLVTSDYWKHEKAVKLFEEYADEVSTQTGSLKAEKINAKADQVVIELAEAITSDQVFAKLFSQYNILKSKDIGSGNQADLEIALVKKKDDGKDYILKGTIVQGEKGIVLKPFIRDDENGKDKSTSLTKGEWSFGYADQYDDECPEWLRSIRSFEIE